MFDFKITGFGFAIADDNTVFGDFGGVGEFVAEGFAGESDGGAVAAGAKLVGETKSIFDFRIGDGNEAEFQEV